MNRLHQKRGVVTTGSSLMKSCFGVLAMGLRLAFATSRSRASAGVIGADTADASCDGAPSPGLSARRLATTY